MGSFLWGQVRASDLPEISCHRELESPHFKMGILDQQISRSATVLLADGGTMPPVALQPVITEVAGFLGRGTP
jgi:hypothetical protein